MESHTKEDIPFISKDGSSSSDQKSFDCFKDYKSKTWMDYWSYSWVNHLIKVRYFYPYLNNSECEST